MNRSSLAASALFAAVIASSGVAAEPARMVFQPEVYRSEHVMPAVWRATDFRIVDAAVRPVVKRRIVTVREWGEFYGKNRNHAEYVDVVQVRVVFDGPPRRLHEYQESVLTFNLPLESFDAATLAQLRRGLDAEASGKLFALDIITRTEDRRAVDQAQSDVREWDVVYKARPQRIVYKSIPVELTAIKLIRQ